MNHHCRTSLKYPTLTFDSISLKSTLVHSFHPTELQSITIVLVHVPMCHYYCLACIHTVARSTLFFILLCHVCYCSVALCYWVFVLLLSCYLTVPSILLVTCSTCPFSAWHNTSPSSRTQYHLLAEHHSRLPPLFLVFPWLKRDMKSCGTRHYIIKNKMARALHLPRVSPIPLLHEGLIKVVHFR